MAIFKNFYPSDYKCNKPESESEDLSVTLKKSVPSLNPWM